MVVVNPRAGTGDAALPAFLDRLGRSGGEATLRYMTPERPISRALEGAEAFDRVVAFGGDGTVSAVAHGLAGSGIPILAYPGGTANLVSMNLGLPTGPRRLADLVLGSPVADVDMGEITFSPAQVADDERMTRTVGFVMAAGAGFDASIMEGARALKGYVGPAAYVVAALQNLNPTVARFTLSLDGRVVETDGIAVLLANFTRLQFDMSLTPTTDVQDGLMDVLVLRHRSAVELLPTLWAMLVDNLAQQFGERPGLEVHTASHVELLADPPLPLQTDGEALDSHTPLTARMMPGAARFVVPDDTKLRTV